MYDVAAGTDGALRFFVFLGFNSQGSGTSDGPMEIMVAFSQFPSPFALVSLLKPRLTLTLTLILFYFSLLCPGDGPFPAHRITTSPGRMQGPVR